LPIKVQQALDPIAERDPARAASAQWRAVNDHIWPKEPNLAAIKQDLTGHCHEDQPQGHHVTAYNRELDCGNEVPRLPIVVEIRCEGAAQGLRTQRFATVRVPPTDGIEIRLLGTCAHRVSAFTL